MKHYTVFYVEHPSAKGAGKTYFKFYASICEELGEKLIELVRADLTNRGVKFKTQCHWDCDTAGSQYYE